MLTACDLHAGQPTSDVTGGKKPSRATKGGSGDSGSARSADSVGSSGSSTKTSGRTQTIHKENSPWR